MGMRRRWRRFGGCSIASAGGRRPANRMRRTRVRRRARTAGKTAQAKARYADLYCMTNSKDNSGSGGATGVLRVGSRGSQLALWQANHIADRLRGAGHEVAIEIIRTLGDAMKHVPFSEVGGAQRDAKGMFTKEIEEALYAGRIDLAVHSLKDLPTELAEPFTIAAIPERVDPRDAFVSVLYASFEALPHGARIGTSSLRRQAQLRAQRGDVVCVEFRGNVDTRLKKLAAGHVDAIILASAGLERLGLTAHRRGCFFPLGGCPS